MAEKKTMLRSTFSVNGEISDNDTRFLNISIDVLHDGLNLNGSVFDKDVVDACVDSIKNTPVLGYVKYNKVFGENDFAGHERILTKTENGVEEVYAGRAYGLIPESCDPRWVTKTCDDGEEREFLRVDALLWDKFSDASSIITRDVEKGQSMELEVSSVEGYEDEDGIFHFEKFRFDGCCILGDDVTPAMTGANVVLDDVQFAANDFMKKIQSELNDKFAIFTKLVSDKIEDEQGGVADMSNENLNEASETNETTGTDFSQTVMGLFNDISAVVRDYGTTTDRWGYEMPRFSLIDIQDDEAIVVDCSDNYNYYGYKYTVDGDKPVVDFACGTRKKVRYENYEDGAAPNESAFDFGKHISGIYDAADKKIAEADTKLSEFEKAKDEACDSFATLKAEYEEIKPKYDEYVKADELRKTEELIAQKDAMFAEYEDVLSENADFTALKENKADMSLDEIETKCALLYVKATRQKANFSKSTQGAVVVGVIGDDDHGNDCDGFVSTKYGNIHVGR